MMMMMMMHPSTYNNQILRGVGEGRVLGHHQYLFAYWTDASRGLSAIAEFLVSATQ